MKSYKCVIIDDEPLICNLINKLGDWDSLNIEVVSICYDGESAIKAIEEHKPDIVLSDIQVPVYNGLEIIEHVQDLNLHPFFIIISGYSQFEYAQRAIQLRAVDYLVKPVQKEKLNSALQKCCDLLAVKSHQSATSTALANAHKELFWNDIYSRKQFGNSAEEFQNRYGKVWNEGDHYAAIINISRPELFEQQELFYDKIHTMIASNLKLNTFSCDCSNGCIYLLISSAANGLENVEFFFQKMFVDIKHLEETLSAFSLTIGFSLPFSSPGGLLSAFQEAQHSSYYRFEHGVDSIYSYANIPVSVYSYKNFTDESLTNNLILYAKNLDTESTRDLLLTAEDLFLKHSGHDYIGLIDFCLFIINCVMNSIHFLEPELLREKFVYEFQFVSTYEAAFEKTEQYISTLINERKEDFNIELSSSVRSAKEYINTHYADKIYLDDIAKSVCLSSAYLSSVFKKELGINITDYIHTVRCENAKNLLKSTPLSIGSIAEKAGYSDEKYFQHQFKKFIGITPAQFRRIYP